MGRARIRQFPRIGCAADMKLAHQKPKGAKQRFLLTGKPVERSLKFVALAHDPLPLCDGLNLVMRKALS